MKSLRVRFCNMAKDIDDRAQRDGEDLIAAFGRALNDIHQTSYEQGVRDTLRRVEQELAGTCRKLMQEREEG